MTTWYVDPVNGNDSTGSGTLGAPYKTIAKLIGGATPVAGTGGDTIYVRGNCSAREAFSITLTPTVETKIIADVDGSAFGGNAGPVIWTAYTTNDTSAPSSSSLMSLGGSNFTFQNFLFVGGGATLINGTTPTAQNIKFTDCAFLVHQYANQACVSVTNSTGTTALNWTFDRCSFFLGNASGQLVFTLVTVTSADYDANVLIENCLLIGTAAVPQIKVSGSGANSFKGGGVKVRNCFIISPSVALNTSTSSLSTSIPCTINNSVIIGNGAELVANTSGQITEDYNLFLAVTGRSNVSVGTHSISSNYAPLFHFGQERIWGGILRKFSEPMAASPLLAFGNDGNQTSYDLSNGPRPAGGGSSSPAVGALERSNTATKETGTVHTGSNALSFTGPGYQDFLVPVNAAATTFTIYARYDSTYAGTRPQVQLLANGEIGVSASTVTATTGALNAWEQQTIGPFTPTAKGWVTLRVISNDTNGAGKAFFDSFAS